MAITILYILSFHSLYTKTFQKSNPSSKISDLGTLQDSNWSAAAAAAAANYVATHGQQHYPTGPYFGSSLPACPSSGITPSSHLSPITLQPSPGQGPQHLIESRETLEMNLNSNHFSGKFIFTGDIR